MNASRHRFVSSASLALMASVAFASCGGLDDRRVTPDVTEAGSGGALSSAAGTDGESGATPAPAPSGGADSNGGATNTNPFGGNLFEGGAPPVLDGPPEVLQVDPADAATDVAVTSDVSLLFSEALAEGSLDDDSFRLLDGGSPVAGTVSLDQLVGRFEPQARLALAVTYEVEVSTDVTDTTGTPLKEAFSSSFTTRDGRWREQDTVIADNLGWAGYQDVAIDARGNALVVWADNTEMLMSIKARWYRRGQWEPVATLDDRTGHAYYPKVAVDADGNAVAAWYVQDPETVTYEVFARRYVDGAWEEAPHNLTQGSMGIFNYAPLEPVVATAGGQATVAWGRVESVPASSSYVYALNLSAAPLNEPWPEAPTENFSLTYVSPNYDYFSGLAATMDSTGNAIVGFVWVSSNPEPPSANYGAGVYYARKAPSGDWQYPAKIPSSGYVQAGPFLASDGDGAMAVWTTYDRDAGTNHVLASRYTAAKQFVAGVDVGDPDLTSDISIYGKALASNDLGYYVTWVQTVGSSRNAYVNHFDVATGAWDELPTLVSDPNSRSSGTPTVGVDAHGNALVIFEQDEQSPMRLAFSRLLASGTWSAPEPLTGDENGYHTPQLAVAANGAAILLFQGGGRGEQAPGSFAGGLFRTFE